MKTFFTLPPNTSEDFIFNNSLALAPVANANHSNVVSRGDVNSNFFKVSKNLACSSTSKYLWSVNSYSERARRFVGVGDCGIGRVVGIGDWDIELVSFNAPHCFVSSFVIAHGAVSELKKKINWKKIYA